MLQWARQTWHQKPVNCQWIWIASFTICQAPHTSFFRPEYHRFPYFFHMFLYFFMDFAIIFAIFRCFLHVFAEDSPFRLPGRRRFRRGLRVGSRGLRLGRPPEASALASVRSSASRPSWATSRRCGTSSVSIQTACGKKPVTLARGLKRLRLNCGFPRWWLKGGFKGARGNDPKILKFGALEKSWLFNCWCIFGYFWDSNFQTTITDEFAPAIRGDMELGGQQGIRWISFRISGNKTW